MSVLTEAERERLEILAEECAEVIQATTKILRHGYDSYHPAGIYDNRRQLEKELGDLIWIISKMGDIKDISTSKVDTHRFEKQQRVGKYLRHNLP